MTSSIAGLTSGLVLMACSAWTAHAQGPASPAEKSSLLAAAARGDAAQIKALIAQGETPDVQDAHGRTPLHAAAHSGHVEVVQTLIRAGAPLNHVNNLGWTALIESIVFGDGGPRHTETLRSLIDGGANVNLPDRNGQTPLALARARGHVAMVMLLQQAGAR